MGDRGAGDGEADCGAGEGEAGCEVREGEAEEAVFSCALWLVGVALPWLSDDGAGDGAEASVLQ